MSASPWPKRPPELTPEQERIKADFVRHWHETVPDRFPAFERFNHGFPAAAPRPAGACRTLELGAGLGGQLAFEDLSSQDYHAVEWKPELASLLRARHPRVTVHVNDCQRRLPFEDGSFDRVLAVHVLEHLTDLPAALREARRVLKPGGVFSVVIPCEGGLLYSLCRRFTSAAMFRRRYGQPYDWFIRSEHFNVPGEILPELERYFEARHTRYFPFLIPSVHANLCIGLHLAPRERSAP